MERVAEARRADGSEVGVTIRVFLLDDHEVVRRGGARCSEAGGDDLVVAGEAGTATRPCAGSRGGAGRGGPRRAPARRQRRGGVPGDPVRATPRCAA